MKLEPYRRHLSVALLATLVLASAGCSSSPTAAGSEQAAAQASSGLAAASPSVASEAARKSRKADSESPAAALPSEAPGEDSEGEPGDSEGSSGHNKKFPAPLNPPGKNAVAVDASVSPLCPGLGDVVTLNVTTEPGAAIGYQAVYSDGKGGSTAPFGAGYGGNDKGFADDDGGFTSSWTISPKAPSGRGRVDVVVGYQGEWGYTAPHFAVADSNGNCPSKWIHAENDGQ